MIVQKHLLNPLLYFGHVCASRTFCYALNSKPNICIVGSGPAGFYAAQHLIKKLPEAQIDLYERLPVPFGLVRFGVAPDHPEVKNVIHTFSKTAERKNIRFLGNINVGTDVSVTDLKNAYHIVLLSYGADESKHLNIPGEKLGNVIEARRIVGWYNGIPWDKDLQIDLSGESATLIGHGNVAIDVARMLLSSVDELKNTDITQHALDKLASSKIKRVFLVGRRGPLQAAFTIKELREMLKLNQCSAKWCEKDFQGISDIVLDLPRPKKRITELMLSSLKSQTAENLKQKEFLVKFCRTPLEFLGDHKVKELKLAINSLRGHDYKTQIAVQTSSSETIPCDLGVTSIGYKSLCIDDAIPFDKKKGIAQNTGFKISEGLYASGWLATGPVGVILTTMSNAFCTAEVIVNDLHKNKSLEQKGGFLEIGKKLLEKNVQVVQWSDWLKIDQHEQEQGKKLEKPREKVLDVGEMLRIASS